MSGTIIVRSALAPLRACARGVAATRDWLGLAAMLSLSCVVPAEASVISLGSAAKFAVLASSTITNTGSTVITGDVGVSPGTAITGFPPGTVNGTVHAGDAVAAQAQTDASTAYITLFKLTPTETLTGMDLGGLTLSPGVYFFSSSAQLTGTLTLVGSGTFVFQIGSTLITASDSDVIAPDKGGNVYWQVGSSATLGTGTAFEGTIIAEASDTLATGATILDGRAIALTGAVTLYNNTVTVTVPEPSTWAMMLIGFAAGYPRTKRNTVFGQACGLKAAGPLLPPAPQSVQGSPRRLGKMKLKIVSLSMAIGMVSSGGANAAIYDYVVKDASNDVVFSFEDPLAIMVFDDGGTGLIMNGVGTATPNANFKDLAPGYPGYGGIGLILTIGGYQSFDYVGPGDLFATPSGRNSGGDRPAIGTDAVFSLGTYALTNGDTLSIGATAIPELSTWVMIALGFAALGLTGFSGARKTARALIED